MNLIAKTGNLDPQGLRQLYGDQALESDLAFKQIMFQQTPSKITPFISARQAISRQMLLTMKAISMPKADSGIFSIRTPDFEGFQFENPQARPARITEELFSNDGGINLIFYQKTDGSTPAISQAEINRVIRSIHKVQAN